MPACMPALSAAWSATAAHPDLGGFDLAGEVSLTTADLVFDSSGERVVIPQRRLLLARDAEGRLVFTDPEQDGWEVTLPDDDILRHPTFARLPVLVRQVRALRSAAESRRTLRLCAAFLGVFALLAALFMAAGPLAVRLAVNRIPVALEVKLGEKFAGDYLEDHRLADEPWAWARLGAVTNQLRPFLERMGMTWRLRVVQGRTPNATALPGGQIMVTTGMLQLVETPEELAGVLAHELAHVTHRHGLQQMVAGLGPLMAIQLALGDQQRLLADMLSGSAALAALSFSRNQEREADAAAFAFLAGAGVDPRGLQQLFLRMEENDRAAEAVFRRATAGEGGGTARESDVFGTHPLTTERITNMEALWQKLPGKERFKPLAWPPGAGRPAP